jgi:hypothetical protein
MVCLEWWLFEIASMLAGVLPNPVISLAVTGVCVQVISFAFMVPLGISSGLRIRVANLLGAFTHFQWLQRTSTPFHSPCARGTRLVARRGELVLDGAPFKASDSMHDVQSITYNSWQVICSLAGAAAGGVEGCEL